MDVERFIASHRIARLATVSATGQPHVVPVVYVYDGQSIYLPLDEKPKRVALLKLRRVRNISRNSRVSLIVDDYGEKWNQLAWVRLDGIAKVLTRGPTHARAIELLRAKYPQYRQMRLEDKPVIHMTIRKRAHWEASHG